jgi:hypothetical protein
LENRGVDGAFFLRFFLFALFVFSWLALVSCGVRNVEEGRSRVWLAVA